MAKSKTVKVANVKKERSIDLQQRINDAEAQVDKLLDFLPPEHFRVKDAKQYVLELEAL